MKHFFRFAAFCFAIFILGCSPKISEQVTNSESDSENAEEYVFDAPLDKNYAPNEHYYTDAILKSTIGSVQFKLKGTRHSYPIIPLVSNGIIELKFDELDSEYQNYTYQIVHCDSNWEPSDLSEFDYIDGFTEGEMDNYEYSHDTTTPYLTYWLELPNANTRFRQSGNYILLVLDEDEETVLSRRFMVYENQWEINSRVVRPNINRYQRSYQNLDFSVYFGDTFISNATQEVSVTVLQNGRWDNAVENLRPNFISRDNLQFRFRDQGLFRAGKEFRYFDLRNLLQPGERVAKVAQSELGPIATIKTDQVEAYEPYSFKRDLNGAFYIYKVHKIFESSDEDYVRVNFSLKTDTAVTKGNVYLYGGFSDWKIRRENQLTYNELNGTYECSRLLKQGLYNYQYVIQEDGSNKIDDSSLEGDFWQTENDYLILVYYRPFNSRFDRLVGIKQINSGLL